MASIMSLASECQESPSLGIRTEDPSYAATEDCTQDWYSLIEFIQPCSRRNQDISRPGLQRQTGSVATSGYQGVGCLHSLESSLITDEAWPPVWMDAPHLIEQHQLAVIDHDGASATVLLKLPIAIVQGTDLASFEPAGYAVKVERVLQGSAWSCLQEGTRTLQTPHATVHSSLVADD
jgi:hypothetical protein